MKTKRSLKNLLLAVSLLLGGHNRMSATELLFGESFSGDLSAWTGKSGGAHQGQIVSDPLVAGNRVLSFSGFNWSGDVFSRLIDVTVHSGGIVLSFDYLGLAVSGSVPGNLGGFVGISDSLNPQANGAAWIAGTEPSAVNGLGQSGIEIADDGKWHHYEIDLTHILTANGITQFHIMIEDWGDAGGVAGDAYFDNVQITAVPEEVGNFTLLAAISILVFIRRRSQAGASAASADQSGT